MKPNLDKRPIVLRQVEFLANNITRVGTDAWNVCTECFFRVNFCINITNPAI